MALITKYGTIWGQIPNTAGSVYWVAPSATYTVEGRAYSASDNNDGKSPERALLTLDYAVGLCTANAGDVIVLLPGAHSWSASVALDVAGVTIMGLPSGAGNPKKQKTSITTSASDQIINVTAANCEIAYLDVIPVTAMAGIDFTAAADQLYIHHCSFDMYTPAANTATVGIGATAATVAADFVTIQNCHFLSDGAQGNGIVLGDAYQALVEDCSFTVYAGTWASAMLLAGITSASGIIRRCHFAAQGATMTVGITGTTVNSTGQAGIYDCRFDENVTTPIEDYSVEDCNIAENYRASADGTAEGGLLWSSTT